MWVLALVKWVAIQLGPILATLLLLAVLLSTFPEPPVAGAAGPSNPCHRAAAFCDQIARVLPGAVATNR